MHIKPDTSWPKLSGRRPGVAAAEMALLLPVLTVLLVLGVDFARVFYYYVAVTNCARNGALYAADPLAPTQSRYPSLTAAAQADWPSGVTPLPTVSGPTTGTDGQGNSYVEVTVTWQFNTISSYLGASGNVSLTRTARMRVAPLTPS